MIENILKLREGKRISRKEYAATKQKFDDLYKDADADTRAKVDGLLMSGNNYSSANPMNNRSAREFSSNLYNHAISMLENPEQDYSVAPSPTVSTANMFNGYSHAENSNNADYVAYRYLTKNKNNSAGSSTGTAPTSSTPATSGTKYYRYNWADGIPWTRETDTLELRTASFAEALKSNIESALNSGKHIIGADKNKLQLALNMFSGWNGDFGQLMRIAQLANVDKFQFEDYFGELYPGMSKSDKSKKVLTDNGYEFVEGGDYGKWMNDLIKDNRYKVAKKGNQYFLIDENYNGPVTGIQQAYLNTDWRDDASQGFGAVIGSDGSFIFGDMSKYYNDESSNYYKLLREAAKKTADNKWYSHGKKYNKFTSQSDKSIINELSAKLHGKAIADVSGYFDGNEVIATVNGDDFNPYISSYGHLQLNDPNFTFYYKNKAGEYVEGKLADVVQNVSDINLNSKKKLLGLSNFQISDVNLDALDWEGNSEPVNKRNWWHNAFTLSHNMVNKWDPEEKTSSDVGFDEETSLFDAGVLSAIPVVGPAAAAITGFSRREQNDLGKYARLMLYAFDNFGLLGDSESERELLHTISQQLKTKQGIRELAALINKAIKEDSTGKFNDPRYVKAFNRFINKYQAYLTSDTSSDPILPKVVSEKQGGILKAEMGTALDLHGNPIESELQGYAASVRAKNNAEAKSWNKLVDRAEANGRTIRQLTEIQLNKWSTADTLRCTALATDVAGLIAAIAGPATSGVGSAIAVGSGFLSMAQDAIADFTDDKVSAGQAWKNIGINTGLAVTAFLGGKAPKIIKSVTKMLPRAIMAIAATGVALDPEVHKTAEKIASGKSLNTNDWRNVMMTLRVAAGIGTTHTLQYKAKKGTQAYNKEYEKQLKGLVQNSEIDPNAKYVGTVDGKTAKLDKSVYDGVQLLLKDNKVDEARNLLMAAKNAETPGAGLSEADANNLLHTIAGQKKGLWNKLKVWEKAPEGETKLIDVTPELAKKASIPADVDSEARIAAIQNLRQQAQSTHKSKTLNAWEGTTFIEQFNPALGAALNEAQVAGKNYKNIRELLTGEEENLGAFLPSNEILRNPDLTDAQKVAMNKKLLTADKAALSRYGSDFKGLESETVRNKNLSEALSAYDTAAKKNSDLRGRIAELRSKISTAKNEETAAGNELTKALSQLERKGALGEDFSGLGAKNKNIETNISTLQKDVDDAKAALQAVRDENPQYFTKDGLLNNKGKKWKNASKVQDLEKAITDAEANLKNYGNRNKIRRQAEWDSYKSKGKVFDDKVAARKKLEEELNAAITEKASDPGGLRKAYGNLRDVQKANKKAEESLSNYDKAKMKALVKEGKSAGESRKAVTVAVDGKEVQVPKGTKAVSYAHIRNPKLAEKAAKFGRPNMKTLSTEEAKKLLPSNAKFRGAAIDTETGKLVIWQQGGKINEKYSHLR